MTIKQFLMQEFNKLILVGLMLTFMTLIVHIMHQPGLDPKAFEWAENGFSAVMGALLMLITGMAKAAAVNTDVVPVAAIPPPPPTKPNTPAAS